MRRVEVQWLDSCRLYDGWQDVAHYERFAESPPSTVHCTSIGWLVAESEQGLVLSLNRGGEPDGVSDSVADGMFIPAASVVAVRELT